MPNPHPQLTLPQQYGRFWVSGALVFTLLFWGLSQVLISSRDAHLNFIAVRLMTQACIHQPFAIWLQKVETAYLPFVFRQRPVLGCYLIASGLAWLAAFLQDTKISRKENAL